MAWGEDLPHSRRTEGLFETSVWLKKSFSEKVDDLIKNIPEPAEDEIMSIPVSTLSEEPTPEEVAAAWEERFNQNLMMLTEGMEPASGQHGSPTVEQFLAETAFLD